MVPEEENYILMKFPYIKKIEDPGIREKVTATLYKYWKKSNYSKIEDVHQFEPARKYISYSNVDHTNQVCRVCHEMADTLKDIMGIQINMDYLLAGAILHDVDKMVIFDARTGGFTEIGRLFPHAGMGASIALMEGLPEEIGHMIGAHSVKFSMVQPKNIEALILRYADLLAAHAFYLSNGLEMDKVIDESLSKLK